MPWEPSVIIAALVSSLTVLASVCGGAWWMSAMFSKLTHISAKLDESIAETRHAAHELRATVQQHEGRITRLEVFSEHGKHE